MNARQRNLNQVPILILVGFVFMLAVQLGYHHLYQRSLRVSFTQLSQPADSSFYRSLAMGSDQLWSYLLTLNVQLHDNQKGRHVNYRHLDYQVLRQWLLTLYEMNPQSDYPAFLASRIYSQVNDPSKIRLMIKLIDELFERDPQQHWRRMTEACLLAKHQLQDLPLALDLAQKVAALPKSYDLPFWARDMQLVLLDELNQYESAQLLISSLLQSGDIKDRDEVRFLQHRLLKIQQKLLENER